MESTFSPSDLDQIKKHGITPERALTQLKQFESGFPYAKLDRPATLQDGIRRLGPEELIQFCEKFSQAQAQGRVMKFVPASGAASRMFQALLSPDKTNPAIQEFIRNIDKFAFYPALCEVIQKAGQDLKALLQNGKIETVLEYLLTEKGLNYASSPKGLIQFHAYEQGSRTPFEEHLVEALNYTSDQKGRARLHFTVAEESLSAVQTHIERVRKKYEKDGKSFDISFSIQKPSTDTLAADMQNKPFHDDNGKLVFRPGGHGALIENVSESGADILFIKNIDNVVPDALNEDTSQYKKALGGYLVAVQEKIFGFLKDLERPSLTQEKRNEILRFMEERFYVSYEPLIQGEPEEAQKQFLFNQLNRPIRVCGMVKNEGEPGGGPFWVQDDNGALSLQVVESSQVDLSDASQSQIWKSSTHFNPVDLVCGLRDYQGKSFDLRTFLDLKTGFISKKSKGGKDLKALELPGLWNGAMAFWNTLFVEVPVSTFTPVKVVLDLLRKQHQRPA